MTTAELKRVLDTVFRIGAGRRLTESEDLAVLLEHVQDQLAGECSDARKEGT